MSTKSDNTAESLAKKLNSALEQGEAAFMLILMEEIKSQGISSVARKAGISRYTLHRYIKEEKHPLFATVTKLTAVCGVKLSFVADKKK
jgi:probable addiction module antidote protein